MSTDFKNSRSDPKSGLKEDVVDRATTHNYLGVIANNYVSSVL